MLFYDAVLKEVSGTSSLLDNQQQAAFERQVERSISHPTRCIWLSAAESTGGGASDAPKEPVEMRPCRHDARVAIVAEPPIGWLAVGSWCLRSRQCCVLCRLTSTALRRSPPVLTVKIR